MPESALILSHLESLFQEVVRAVTGGDAGQWGKLGYNAKGDQVKWFDLAADRAVSDYLAETFPYPVRLWSEEGVPRDFGRGEPEFIMVLDPVDGSNNFGRGIAPAGMAAALIPAHLPVAADTVQFALVGDLFTGQTWAAARDEGAFGQGQRLMTSRVTRLDQALLSCDLDQLAGQAPLVQVVARAQGARAFGSAARALVMVAAGAVEAHLDLRQILTPENFLAPALIITEAGGKLTDGMGKPLPPIRSLTEGYSILATASPELHTAIIEALWGEISVP